MGIPGTATASARLDAGVLDRLSTLGIVLAPTPAADAAPGADEYAHALDLAAEQGVIAVVAERGADRRDIAERLDAASRAAASGSTRAPLAVVVLPATLPTMPGPVAILSPTTATSSYELYLGAAVAAATGRRVEHLNARGTLASAQHSGIAGRVLARAAAHAWHERTHAHPERALHTLESRPGAVVVPVTRGSTDAAQLVADHPDADVLLVFDRAHAQHGGAVAQQVATMIELAFGLGASAEPARTALPEDPTEPADESTAPAAAEHTPDPAADLPGIRASDVIHLRLTSTHLELTNRTAQRVALRVALGSADEPDVARADFACELGPRDAVSTEIDGVAGIQDLARPLAVLRHWSHESEEVYEGGDLRVVEFRVGVLDASGAVRAERAYRPGNGLDFFVTARDLTALLGRPVARSVLPEPAQTQTAAAAPRDILGALASALEVGAGVLGTRGVARRHES